jgi:hypothetical protein
MITWIEGENSTWWEGICYSLGIGLVSHTRVYLYRRGITIYLLIENGLTSILNQVVFDKILSIPSTSLNMIDFGMISSMISSDASSIGIYVYFCVIGISGFFVLFPAIGILAFYHGWYSLFAIFWIGCLLLTNNSLN